MDYTRLRRLYRRTGASRLVLEAPTDVAELVECYESTLSALLDKFARQRQIRINTASVAKRLHVSCRSHIGRTMRSVEMCLAETVQQPTKTVSTEASSLRPSSSTPVEAAPRLCGQSYNRCYSRILTVTLSYLPTTSRTFCDDD